MVKKTQIYLNLELVSARLRGHVDLCDAMDNVSDQGSEEFRFDSWLAPSFGFSRVQVFPFVLDSPTPENTPLKVYLCLKWKKTAEGETQVTSKHRAQVNNTTNIKKKPPRAQQKAQAAYAAHRLAVSAIQAPGLSYTPHNVAPRGAPSAVDRVHLLFFRRERRF